MSESEYSYFIVPCIILALIPIIIFCGMIPYKIEQDKTIQIEGTITEKKIDRGFGTNYIFVIDSTDVPVSQTNYWKFSVGDYVIIYESGRIKLG